MLFKQGTETESNIRKIAMLLQQKPFCLGPFYTTIQNYTSQMAVKTALKMRRTFPSMTGLWSLWS